MSGLTLTSANGGGPAQAVAFALLIIVVPLFGGIVLGRTLRQWRWGALLGVFAIALLTLAAVEGVQHVGAWDVISVGALLAIGLLLGGARVDWESSSSLVVSSVLALAILEATVRWWLPLPPRFPSPSEAALIFKPSVWDAGCSVLYGSASVENGVRALRHGSASRHVRKDAPLVVHLGDSMTYGEGVSDEETFAALLDARQPAVMHRNYGVWAVGTDFEYLLLRRILAEQTPAMVVLHVYVGNDVYDIDRPYACCDAGPLLDYGPGGPTARCASARWSFPLTFRLSRSPPPYPLRVATSWSYTARHAAAAFSRLVSRLEPRADFIRTEGEAEESGWEHFAQILAQLRDELPANVDLIVDLLPNRQALEAADPTDLPSYRAGQRVAQITAKLGIRTLDAWDLLANAVKRDGSHRYFRDQNDIHFTPEGHRLVTDWLEMQLPSATQSPPR
jgi:hypothetical protein